VDRRDLGDLASTHCRRHETASRLSWGLPIHFATQCAGNRYGGLVRKLLQRHSPRGIANG
jgi:hypothetical protein